VTIFLGIDPGLTGGLAWIDHTGRCGCEDLPTKPLPGGGLITKRIDGRALADLLLRVIPAGEAVHVTLEQVGAMGGKNNAMQIQASLTGSLQSIQVVLDILRLTPHMVSPQTWKKRFGLGRLPEEKPSTYKARHVALARKLYPQAPLPLAKDHNKAEALLLAHYGRVVLA